MKSILYFLLSVILLSFCYSCSRKSLFTNKIDVVFEKDTLLTLENWCGLGPFNLDTTKNILDRQSSDFLSISEGMIKSLDDFIDEGEALSSVNSSLILQQLRMPKYMLTMNFDNVEWVPPATSYLATSVESPSDTAVVLALSAYQACDLWVNGELCYSVEWKRGPNKFREEYIPISLKKGKNLILLKTSILDVKTYNYTQWKVLLDVVNSDLGKDLFERDYGRFFIRRSMLNKDNSILKIYTGPYSKSDKLHVTIESDDGEVIHNQLHKATVKNGLIAIDMKSFNTNGFHLCKVCFDNKKYSQTFFYGDIDSYLDSLKAEYDQLNVLSHSLDLNIRALINRIHIDKRRGRDVLDDIAEYWDGLRVPSLQKLDQTIKDLKRGIDPTSKFFLHSFYSNVLDRDYYYSAHIPSDMFNKPKSVFFMIDSGSADFTDDWRAHWRNELYGVENLFTLADKYNFVIVWSDCGGGEDLNLNLKIFEEILNHINETLSVDTNRFVIGNCATTSLALYLCANTSKQIKGCGFLNPLVTRLPVGLKNKNISLAQISAYNDEEIPFDLSCRQLHEFRKVDPKTPLYIDYTATHHKAQASYMEPIIQYFTSLINY